MPMIGNQATQGRFIELDSLSASATANYTLQLNSANFAPESVNNLLVSINGVIQGSSTMSLNGAVLTVGATLSSSDTIDFVRVFGNVGTVSTPTDGSVTANKIGTGAVVLTSKVSGVLPVANGGTGQTASAQSAQTFSLQANEAGSDNNGEVFTNLLEVNDNYTRVGSVNWSHSSGVFSSATTGTFFCSWQVVLNVGSGGDNFDPKVTISTDSGSSYNGRSYAWGGIQSGYNGTVSSSFIFTVDNATTFRLRFHESSGNSISSNSTIIGNADYVTTGITFVKLGVL